MKHEIRYVDYHCYPVQEDHHYAKRLVANTLAMVKVRYTLNDDSRLYLKIDYVGGYMEVWNRPEETDRIRINSVTEPDFADRDKMITKIRTYLTFS
jgi:hypothetical protein